MQLRLLANDDTAFEQTDASTGLAYQDAVALAKHNYQQAAAQADHDLTVTDDAAAFSTAMAAASDNEVAAFNQAYSNFAAFEGPALTLDGTDNANADELDSQTIADEALADIKANNLQVDAYQDWEATDYNVQQRAQAQALDNYQAANANGRAAAIAAFDLANPSPWADYAAAQAAADATLIVAQAGAQLAQAFSQADSQKAQEQAQNDATETKDNTLAQAEHDQAVTDAQAKQAEETAQAAATDKVFENLPDTLIAPADGQTPILTGDFGPGYEAVDFYLGGTVVADTSMGDVFAGWSLLGPATPHFTPRGNNCGVRQAPNTYNSDDQRPPNTANFARTGPADPRVKLHEPRPGRRILDTHPSSPPCRPHYR